MVRRALAAAVLLALAGTAQAAEPATCKTVRFAESGWTDVAATTAVASLILKSLGYEPRTSLLSVPAIYASMKKQQIDAFLGNWMPVMAEDRKPFVDDGSVEVLGANLEGAKYTLAVPTYLYDQGLHDFSDIARFGPRLDWRIHGLEPGNDGNRQLLDLIKSDRFGLGKFQLVQSSEKAMLAAVERAYQAQQPILFLGWEPHPMNLRYRISYLAGGDASFGPNYGGGSVYTNVRAGYERDCPNAGRLLGNLRFTPEGEGAIMATILERRGTAPQAAASWLKANPGVLDAWLDGVTTFDGMPALPAVQRALGS